MIIALNGKQMLMLENTVSSLNFSDAKIFCCKLPKIQTKRPNLRLFCQNGAKGIANSEDPEEEQSDLGLHCWHRPICLKT